MPILERREAKKKKGGVGGSEIIDIFGRLCIVCWRAKFVLHSTMFNLPMEWGCRDERFE